MPASNSLAYLYQANKLPMSGAPSLSNSSCGPITTTITSVVPNDGDTPLFTIDMENGTIDVNPNARPQAGTYVVYVTSCVYVQNSADVNDVTEICS